MAHLFTLEHFKKWSDTLDRRMSSAVVIIEDGEKAVLVKANYKSHWTFPGGAVDPGESPKQAAIREVHEEIGLELDPAKVEFGWVTSRSSKVAMSYQFVFRCPLEDSMLDNITLQVEEIEDWRVITKQEVLSSNLNYSKAAGVWARDSGDRYLEQTFGSAQD